ncbi:hypothetical protein FOFC_15659 [Fusarium oxysporum]|nr:hypothetical protein FOFC_15659 [Fusarium oxysporum]
MRVVSWYVQLACVADPQSVHHNCQRWCSCVLKWNVLCLGQIDPANFVQGDLELFQDGNVAGSRVLYRYGLCVTETETFHSGHAVLDGKLISSNEI